VQETVNSFSAGSDQSDVLTNDTKDVVNRMSELGSGAKRILATRLRKELKGQLLQLILGNQAGRLVPMNVLGDRLQNVIQLVLDHRRFFVITVPTEPNIKQDLDGLTIQFNALLRQFTLALVKTVASIPQRSGFVANSRPRPSRSGD
jgi:hypothetical protein